MTRKNRRNRRVAESNWVDVDESESGTQKNLSYFWRTPLATKRKTRAVISSDEKEGEGAFKKLDVKNTPEFGWSSPEDNREFEPAVSSTQNLAESMETALSRKMGSCAMEESLGTGQQERADAGTERIIQHMTLIGQTLESKFDSFKKETEESVRKYEMDPNLAGSILSDLLP